MTTSAIEHDAIVVGGGFYGAVIAVYLARERGLKRIVLLEQEQSLLSRASYVNQARIHNGYHYPRSFTTAYRSRINQPKFVRNWPNAVNQDFVKLYGIARNNSKVTPNQFELFCRDIGAKIEPAESSLVKLFSERLIAKVYKVEEYAFDSTKLALWAERELKECGVNILFKTRAEKIVKAENGSLLVMARANSGLVDSLNCRYVMNCTYSGLNHLSGDYYGTRSKLKHEITEMALIVPPGPLRGLGVTVMDGPFFSMMPFPARGLNTLSHVRYTPHLSWSDEQSIDPYRKIRQYECSTRADRMIRDVRRYLPAIADAEYVESMFEIKTVLAKNESDDGRPILFEKSIDLPGCYSILGGKIDNIFDVLERLDCEVFE